MPHLGFNEEETLDLDQVVQDAKEQGIKDIIVNDNGSLTYIMSKSKHKEMMDEMQKGITEPMDNLISGEDFTKFDVVVIRDQFEESVGGFGILGLAFNSLFYQLFDTIIYPDVLDGKW